VARVVALAPDLLFASKIEATLRAAGHEVQIESIAAEAIGTSAGADVVIVDLHAPDLDTAALVSSLAGKPLLGFYSHVDVETKEGAEAAGFDLVVPRSRMAREMAGLVERLASG
jgi:DNA-binding NarL/FixJ family response regulator